MLKDYRVMYLRSVDGRPVGCVAIQINRKQRTLQYGYSVLNPADKFDRKVARQLALGRLMETPVTVAPIFEEVSMHEISRAVMQTISTDRKAPARAVKAAKSWMYLNTI